MSPLLAKYFYSVNFNKHVKIVQQPEIKLYSHDWLKDTKQKNSSFITNY